MKKVFNTTGLCIKEYHYMVDITRTVEIIRQMADRGEYFVINRARQFGKTTTLHVLKQVLMQDYAVISISLEGVGEVMYHDEFAFCRGLGRLILGEVKYGKTEGLDPAILERLRQIGAGEAKDADFLSFAEWITDLCVTAERPIILIVDEVDQASGWGTFLDFLGMLRNKYLRRMEKPTFHSVILAGVYDIKNLKLKIRQNEEHKYNSPWNIAVDFNVDMAFGQTDIISMLKEYEQDYHTGMDIGFMSRQIYEYTSGYPYLVSRLCQLLDEQIAGTTQYPDRGSAWTCDGFQDAVKLILKESNTLFDDMRKKISDYPELKDMLNALLFKGIKIPFNPDNAVIDIAIMFGFICQTDGGIAVANRIFETRLYNLFLSENLMNNCTYDSAAQDIKRFMQGNRLNMELILQKFMEHFTEVYADSDQKFVEENGRRIFLLYLKPIINGTGNYYIEARTRNMKRTDIIVDYLGNQYVIELKIWHGREYNSRGEKQLFEYLEYYHKDKGYLLSFNFNKSKQVGMKDIEYQGKKIVEVVV